MQRSIWFLSFMIFLHLDILRFLTACRNPVRSGLPDRSRQLKIIARFSGRKELAQAQPAHRIVAELARSGKPDRTAPGQALKAVVRLSRNATSDCDKCIAFSYADHDLHSFVRHFQALVSVLRDFVKRFRGFVSKSSDFSILSNGPQQLRTSRISLSPPEQLRSITLIFYLAECFP